MTLFQIPTSLGHFIIQDVPKVLLWSKNFLVSFRNVVDTSNVSLREINGSRFHVAKNLCYKNQSSYKSFEISNGQGSFGLKVMKHA